jgi:long-chain acyl-CoA synthetase
MTQIGSESSAKPRGDPTNDGASAPTKDTPMNRIWLSAYPAGVPAEADIETFRSINELFDHSVAEFADRPACVSMGTTLTYAELDRLSAQFASYLQHTVELAHGARVALMMPNLLQYPIALFGVLRAGCTVVNCNPLYTPRELNYQLTDSGAELVVAFESRAFVLQQALEGTSVRQVVITQAGDMLNFPRGIAINFIMRHVKHMVPAWQIPGAMRFRAALRLGADTPRVPVDVSSDDLAFLQYTGGTTGVPKGAMLTHANLVANLQQAHAWLKPFMSAAQETILTALPLYHIFALTVSLVFFKIGGNNVLVADPRNISGLIGEMRRHRISVLIGVNTLFNAMLNNPGFAKLDFSALWLCLGGGMATQRAVAERWHEVTGRPLIEAYGLTETSPALTANPLDLPTYSGSIGLPLPSTDVVIRDDNGNDVPPGEVGELCARGPQVMKGYWRRPDETAKVMTPDGYIRTGDMATMDPSGWLRIVDRKKDMIIVSGFNIYPNEVEDVVAMHEGVLEVGAVGIADPVCGEVVKIVVVRKDITVTAEELITHCRRFLTGYKVPQLVQFAESLPKSPIGKILRKELRQSA